MQLKNTNCDKTLKTEIVTKFKNSNYDKILNSNGEKTQKVKL